jgi:hypothetical protein
MADYFYRICDGNKVVHFEFIIEKKKKIEKIWFSLKGNIVEEKIWVG